MGGGERKKRAKLRSTGFTGKLADGEENNGGCFYCGEPYRDSPLEARP
jgi:hypothetical protein